jgi:type III secretion system protein
MVEKIYKPDADVAVNIHESLCDIEFLERIIRKKKHTEAGDQAPSTGMLSGETSVRLLNMPTGGFFQTMEMGTKGVVVKPSDKGDSLRRQLAMALTASTMPVPAMTVPSKPDVANTAQQGILQESRNPEETVEVKPELPAVRPLGIVLQQSAEEGSKTQNGTMTRQQLKAQIRQSVKASGESHLLVVDYAFQRWAGEHSVKVLVPMQVSRETNITLLPSDRRAADMLSRHMGHLTGLTAELLPPHRARDEQQRQRQHHQAEEQE